MVKAPLPLSSRLLMGAIAGFVATLPMTVTMRALHKRLPRKERYPAPPRELIDSAAEAIGANPAEPTARDLTLLAHYAYGAAAGALTAAALPDQGPVTGAAAGVTVWAGSYFGWIPAMGLLGPASEHPARRNLMMVAAHIVWGAAAALVLRELSAERTTVVRGGPGKDRA